MSETKRVEKNVDYLKILCKCKSNMRKVIITNADILTLFVNVFIIV
jgi:hypothetical protein